MQLKRTFTTVKTSRSFQLEMNTVLFFLVLVTIVDVQGSQTPSATEAPVRRCAWQNNTAEQAPYRIHQVDDDVEEGSPAERRGVLDGQPFVQCARATNACYSLWHVDVGPNGTSVNVFNIQGCWEGSKVACQESFCAADKKPPKALNTTRFCCCTGDFCNVNVSDMYLPENDPVIVPPVESPYQARTQQPPLWAVIVGVGLLMGVACSALIAAYRLWLGRREKPARDPRDHLLEAGGPGNDLYSVEHLKLAAVVGQGRYGSVWKGNVRDQEVAVKIFPSHYRNYFLNERDIYLLPFMDNPALLSYFGCDERVSLDGNAEYLLVLSYAPNGCLQDYLRVHTVDCATFCKMALTVAKGLAHLHTDLRKGDKCKPCVSHRDLNTRNILVKNDLTCCLCDLGFAMKISGSKYFFNGEEQHAETKSINDVGTLRYMAPEVLEGAVNLRDCESSLKQIDVYALGLVLWEIASRCSDFYQGGAQQTPHYSLPFEAEVGHHPTFEQMQVLVSRHKARPLFPEAWRDWTAIRLLRETVEDCWDQDAEARLTALCVEERVLEMPQLWDRKRATVYGTGVSPTVNGTLFNNTETGRLIESEGSLDKEAAAESTASEGTVDTLLALTPSEPHDPPYKILNHAIGVSCRPPALHQPFQGRNPCLERNLNVRSSEDEAAIVDRSFKHATARFNVTTPPVELQLGSPSEGQQLVAHDYLGMAARPATPIPYVQNVSAIPKQPNVPRRQNSRWGWLDVRRLFARRNEVNVDETKSNLLARTKSPLIVDTQVCLPEKNGKAAVTSVMAGNGFVSSTPEEPKSRRPSTLPLVAVKPETRGSRASLDGQFYSNGTVANSASRLLKRTNSRVKTPGDGVPSSRRGKNPAARFSLYDDRMMTAGGDRSDCLSELAFSSSVPTDIDISYVECDSDRKVEIVVAPFEKDSSSF